MPVAHDSCAPVRTRLRRCLGFGSFVLASLVTLLPAPASAQTTSANGLIAYVASGPSTIPFGSPTQLDIWVMNPDGSNARNVTNTSDVDEFNPAWSPDGKRIAYVSDFFSFTLTIMDADGGNKTTLATGANSPTWNPAGTQIAYVRSRGGLPVNIVIQDLATGIETEVTGPVDFGGGVFVDVDEMEPSWSPTGDKIAFTSIRPEQYVDLITGLPVTGAQFEIVTVNVDGSGEQVVSRGIPGSDRAIYLEDDRAPSWSPDGRMILFMSQAQIPACCGPWQVWAVNRDGSAATNLTNDDTVYDLFPSWSPDGSLILFTRSDATGWNLYTMPAPTSLPLAAALAAPSPAAATGAATPLTTDGNAQDGVWARAQAPDPAGFTLSVDIGALTRGAGGAVFSLPLGILCGGDCTETYATGTRVFLFAVPKRGSKFAGWSGACSGLFPACSVKMDAALSVTANFRKR